MRNPNVELLLFLKNRLALKAHTKQELVELWQDRNDSGIDEKTVDRNVEFMERLGYEVMRGFDNRKRIYRIIDDYENEILEKIENHLRISETPELANSEIVASAPVQRGIQWVPLLLESINNCRTIEFEHHPYTSDPSKKEVCPVILKEYQGKWHLHGYDIHRKKYRTYGIDRIRDLKQLDKYDWNLLPDLEKEISFFKSRLGAAMPLPGYFKKGDIQPEIIQLRVSDFYLNYLKSKPMHSSQEIIEDDVIHLKKLDTKEAMGFTLVKYYLVPNYDLVKFIMSQLGDVTIENPGKLKKYVNDKFHNLITHISGKHTYTKMD
ncbi:helix-turn-helix transcriptional regulator [Robiginitalea aurantiaca]|uniref:WYL domain-containing protein n=1 Tax=Robiginitalea aurantiaca TaxID=3056915 RepID=A0ABT7WBF7_9FLAO|nr:WYL domain-containing protein [Robiginitalea aurantiaca]MDM9630251.1 WYL domain-containing protein [Robiginitalea aurantiaca]